MKRYGRYLAGSLGFVLVVLGSPQAWAKFTVCNNTSKTYTYAIVQNFWNVSFQTLLPYSNWRSDGWFELGPGCGEILEREAQISGFLLLRYQAGKKWVTAIFPERDIGLGNATTGTRRQFCISWDQFRRWTDTLDEQAVCPSYMKAETFSVYFQKNVDAHLRLTLE